jgi:hypothetical protein
MAGSCTSRPRGSIRALSIRYPSLPQRCKGHLAQQWQCFEAVLSVHALRTLMRSLFLRECLHFIAPSALLFALFSSLSCLLSSSLSLFCPCLLSFPLSNESRFFFPFRFICDSVQPDLGFQVSSYRGALRSLVTRSKISESRTPRPSQPTSADFEDVTPSS